MPLDREGVLPPDPVFQRQPLHPLEQLLKAAGRELAQFHKQPLGRPQPEVSSRQQLGATGKVDPPVEDGDFLPAHPADLPRQHALQPEQAGSGIVYRQCFASSDCRYLYYTTAAAFRKGFFPIPVRKSIFVFVSLNVYFAALKAATKGSPWMGPSFTWMDQDPRGPWTRCQKNVVSSLREMPANAVWPANVFLAIAFDSVTQA